MATKLRASIRIVYFWLWRTAQWLREAWLLFITIGVIVFVPVLVLWSGADEQWVRIAGMVLQLLGVLAAAWGVLKTRASFRMESFRSWVSRWLARRPPFRMPARTANFNMVDGGDTSHASAQTNNVPLAQDSLEQRMELIERTVAQLNQRIDEALPELCRIEALVQHERSERASEVAAARQETKDSATGGLHITAAGLLCLFFGVILSTASEEICRLLQ